MRLFNGREEATTPSYQLLSSGSTAASMLTLSSQHYNQLAQGDIQHICIRGGQSKKFSGNPKISLHLHCHPKISARFTLGNLCMNIEYPEIMQIEVRIAASEHRNISSTIFGPKNITFGNILTQKYRTYLPACAFTECPPPWAS